MTLNGMGGPLGNVTLEMCQRNTDNERTANERKTAHSENETKPKVDKKWGGAEYQCQPRKGGEKKGRGGNNARSLQTIETLKR